MKKELILIFFIVLLYSCSSVRVIYDFDSTINFSNYSSFAFSKQEVEKLDISDVLKKKNVFALQVNGDSMIDACIADGDMVLMEPLKDAFSLKNGTIVSAMVPGLGTTLKYFYKRGGKIFLEAANPAYEPIELNLNEVVFQGKLLAVWRKI